MRAFSSLNAMAKLAAICASVLMLGCETPPTALERDFGVSVRSTIALQTAQPGQETPALDGVKAETSFRKYQGAVAEPSPEAVLINIDTGTSD
jgi:hypothetical protein